ncbi:PP2C family protein-serine/threonine phosphatase [Actinomadura viridis]|uniref:Serine phosphatase RsbU (Regulator of sigma subunit) n=1 Tax=Actinomadura viridis TaxID=58110 RepID=A0A931DLS7_9ACTN|nr:PP2C family protein-serine/threonine phosphatase [Actinomadura viridis]MBG6093569.1 serine phosphatase RsbU (regulator of sigma subunit) [Actinomadura viridis]
MDRALSRERMLAGLVRASHLVTLENLPDVISAHAAVAGMSEVLIYLADLQEEMLFLFPGRTARAGGAGDRPDEVPVEGTVAGRAFQHGEIVSTSAGRGGPGRWWIPLLDGAERLGVLRVTAEEAGGDVAWDMRDLAGLVALLVQSKRRTSDTYASLVRRRPMNVAAEMEWRLIPPRTYATDRVVISAVMEPAYEVSGDAFDYALRGDSVHLSVFDAMGHDTAAGLTAGLAIAACRNHRRLGEGLADTARRIEETLLAQFGGERFATGLLAELDVAGGLLSWINHGHPRPVIIRDGRSLVRLECEPAPPLGLGLDTEAVLCQDQLEPGDRLVLYTDGITEARSPEGREFGLERFVDFLIRHHADGLPVAETLRRLVRHHLDYHQGRLGDDATVLLLEWHGPAPFAEGQAEALVGIP